MDLVNVLKLPHAKSSKSVTKSSMASLPATTPPSLRSVTSVKMAVSAKGLAKQTEAEVRPQRRPTREERKLEKRNTANKTIDDLLDNKPTKSKIREFLKERVSTLLEERGVATMR